MGSPQRGLPVSASFVGPPRPRRLPEPVQPPMAPQLRFNRPMVATAMAPMIPAGRPATAPALPVGFGAAPAPPVTIESTRAGIESARKAAQTQLRDRLQDAAYKAEMTAAHAQLNLASPSFGASPLTGPYVPGASPSRAQRDRSAMTQGGMPGLPEVAVRPRQAPKPTGTVIGTNVDMKQGGMLIDDYRMNDTYLDNATGMDGSTIGVTYDQYSNPMPTERYLLPTQGTGIRYIERDPMTGESRTVSQSADARRRERNMGSDIGMENQSKFDAAVARRQKRFDDAIDLRRDANSMRSYGQTGAMPWLIPGGPMGGPTLLSQPTYGNQGPSLGQAAGIAKRGRVDDYYGYNTADQASPLPGEDVPGSTAANMDQKIADKMTGTMDVYQTLQEDPGSIAGVVNGLHGLSPAARRRFYQQSGITPDILLEAWRRSGNEPGLDEFLDSIVGTIPEIGGGRIISDATGRTDREWMRKQYEQTIEGIRQDAERMRSRRRFDDTAQQTPAPPQPQIPRPGSGGYLGPVGAFVGSFFQ